MSGLLPEDQRFDSLIDLVRIGTLRNRDGHVLVTDFESGPCGDLFDRSDRRLDHQKATHDVARAWLEADVFVRYFERVVVRDERHERLASVDKVVNLVAVWNRRDVQEVYIRDLEPFSSGRADTDQVDRHFECDRE